MGFNVFPCLVVFNRNDLDIFQSFDITFAMRSVTEVLFSSTNSESKVQCLIITIFRT